MIRINKWPPKKHESGSVKQRNYSNWSSVIFLFLLKKINIKSSRSFISFIVGVGSHAELYCGVMGIFRGELLQTNKVVHLKECVGTYFNQEVTILTS